MIKKIIRIENVGVFASCTAANDVEFRQLNLIHGENARGKSTLATIFRSLGNGDPSAVLGRKSLGTGGGVSIEVLLADGVAKFDGLHWSRTFPSIHVFDQTFVHENVYAGDFVEHEQKKSLHGVIVGREGVALAREVEALDRQIRDQTKVISEHKAALLAYLPKEWRLEAFLGLETEADLETRIPAKQNEIAMLERAQEIASTVALSPLTLPTIPDDLSLALSATIEGVGEEAEKLVREHLKGRGVSEQWISEGLDANPSSCPFCGRELHDVHLFDAYRGYFGQAYGTLKQKVATVGKDINQKFGDGEIQRLRAAVEKNFLLVKFWSPVVGPADLGVPEFAARLQDFRDAATGALSAKRSALLEGFEEPVTLTQARAAIEGARQEVAEANERIAEYNRLIAAAKAETVGKSLAQSRSDLLHLQLSETRYSEPASSGCSDYLAAIKTKTVLEKLKEDAKGALDRYSETTFADHHAKVNQLLEAFGATFRITRPVRSYIGGSPSTSYGILINHVEIELGDRDVPLDQPSFRNTLSSSDRSTLALAFFLSSCEHDPEIAKKVVVLDDPFTSQDRTRQWHTQQQIMRLADRALQVVVLSHHPPFLKPIADEVEPARVKALQLMRVGNASTIVPWDPAEAGDQFAQEYRKLTRYIDSGVRTAAEKRDVARAIRPLLESRVRMLCPFDFRGCQQFGQVLEKIRTADAELTTSQLQPILADLEELNAFSRRYMHGENPAAETEPIDDGELLTYVKKAIRIAQGLPE